MNKSTPINQLPKSMPPTNEPPNEDDDIAIQEVLAEITAQERQAMGQTPPMPQPQAQSFPPPMPPPQPQRVELKAADTQSQTPSPYYQMPQMTPQMAMQMQQLQQQNLASAYGLLPQPPQPALIKDPWYEKILDYLKNQSILFIVVAVVVFLVQQNCVQSLLQRYIENPLYLQVGIAVLVAVLVLLGQFAVELI